MEPYPILNIGTIVDHLRNPHYSHSLMFSIIFAYGKLVIVGHLTTFILILLLLLDCSKVNVPNPESGRGL